MSQLKHLVSVADFSPPELERILARARAVKAEWKAGGHEPVLQGQTLAMIFEKPSLRTRVTFEAGMTQLGGHAIYLAPADIGLGTRESVPDVARNLSRWVQVILARTFAHATVQELAAHATVPVINALSDREHPCQALADYLTILERWGAVAGLPVAFVGDGNNVCHSFLLLGAALGARVTVGCPPGYTPDVFIVEQARALAAQSGGQVAIVSEARQAVEGAAVVYTDVWTSMGQESEASQRRRTFQPYQVNAALLAHADREAIVLHCLPAHRGEEITDEVLDGPQSAVLDQAENRLHAQKALILELLGR